jgi:hypothetical protein
MGGLRTKIAGAAPLAALRDGISGAEGQNSELTMHDKRCLKVNAIFKFSLPM